MGMVYSGSLLIPLQTQYMALNGLEKILGMMKTIREAGFPMEILGILPCMYDVRTSSPARWRSTSGKRCATRCSGRSSGKASPLPRRPPARRTSSPTSRGDGGAEDYRALAQEVLRHG